MLRISLFECSLSLSEVVPSCAEFCCGSSVVQKTIGLLLSMTLYHAHEQVNTAVKAKKIIVYGSRQMLEKLPEFHISLSGKELVPADFVKDLGVTFDKYLTFNEHTINTMSSCISTLAQISRVKHIFKNELITIINALVFSKLYYCSSVWSNTTMSNVNKLQKVQNFAARIVSNTR